MNVIAVATTPDWSSPIESLWVSLETDQGRYRLEGNGLISEAKSDEGGYRWTRFAAFEDHLHDSEQAHLGLHELRCSDDGDTFLLFEDGSCMGVVRVAVDHSDLAELSYVLRFYSPGRMDADLASSISEMKCVRI
ncbi:MAG: hypothetical protein IPJ76_02645 [Flavobacteriales bacterium]|nr:MAG: hypothetical protein IPJ76_02645 [Flavobacteriales bacterium]